MFTFWEVSTFGTLIVYGALYDFRMLYIWLAFLGVYLFAGFLCGNNAANPNRRTIRMGTWKPPSEPNVYAKIEVNLAKVYKTKTRQTNLSKKWNQKEPE